MFDAESQYLEGSYLTMFRLTNNLFKKPNKFFLLVILKRVQHILKNVRLRTVSVTHIHPEIEAFSCHQFFMSAALNDTAVVDNQNFVGFANR